MKNKFYICDVALCVYFPQKKMNKIIKSNDLITGSNNSYDRVFDCLIALK